MISNLISFFISYRLQRERFMKHSLCRKAYICQTGESSGNWRKSAWATSSIHRYSAPADMDVSTARARLQEMGRNVALVAS